MEVTMHTPGPWRSLIIAPNNMDSGTTMVATPNGSGLAIDCADSGLTFAESAANARLIAAAPDLLEALKGVLRVADRATDEFDAARAAIAKAAPEQVGDEAQNN
jgi:hypothetical protein